VTGVRPGPGGDAGGGELVVVVAGEIEVVAPPRADRARHLRPELRHLAQLVGADTRPVLGHTRRAGIRPELRHVEDLPRRVAGTVLLPAQRARLGVAARGPLPGVPTLAGIRIGPGRRTRIRAAAGRLGGRVCGTLANRRILNRRLGLRTLVDRPVPTIAARTTPRHRTLAAVVPAGVTFAGVAFAGATACAEPVQEVGELGVPVLPFHVPDLLATEGVPGAVVELAQAGVSVPLADGVEAAIELLEHLRELRQVALVLFHELAGLPAGLSEEAIDVLGIKGEWVGGPGTVAVGVTPWRGAAIAVAAVGEVLGPPDLELGFPDLQCALVVPVVSLDLAKQLAQRHAHWLVEGVETATGLFEDPFSLTKVVFGFVEEAFGLLAELFEMALCLLAELFTTAFARRLRRLVVAVAATGAATGAAALPCTAAAARSTGAARAGRPAWRGGPAASGAATRLAAAVTRCAWFVG
jgi:hypothetical protein